MALSLYPHQQKAVSALVDIHETRYKDVWVADYEHVTCQRARIYTSVALLYDPPQTGKMITALAWCATCKHKPHTDTVVSTGRFYQDVVRTVCPTGTLVVCKPTKHKHWLVAAEQILGHVVAVTSRAQLEAMQQPHVGVVVCKLFDGLFDALQGTRWARAIYDDCDTWPTSQVLPTVDFTLLIGTGKKTKLFSGDPYLVEHFSMHTEEPILSEKRELYYYCAYAGTSVKAEVAKMSSHALLDGLCGARAMCVADAMSLCCWQPAHLWSKLTVRAASALRRAPLECQVCLTDTWSTAAVVMSCCGCLLCPTCAIQANRFSPVRGLCGLCAHCKADCSLLDLTYITCDALTNLTADTWRDPPRCVEAQVRELLPFLVGRVHIEGLTTTQADHTVDHLVLIGDACHTWQKSKQLSAVYRIGRESVLTVHYVWPT